MLLLPMLLVQVGHVCLNAGLQWRDVSVQSSRERGEVVRRLAWRCFALLCCDRRKRGLLHCIRSIDCVRPSSRLDSTGKWRASCSPQQLRRQQQRRRLDHLHSSSSRLCRPRRRLHSRCTTMRMHRSARGEKDNHSAQVRYSPPFLALPLPPCERHYRRRLSSRRARLQSRSHSCSMPPPMVQIVHRTRCSSCKY